MKKVALIGAGNVNWHLGHALPKRFYQVCQVYSRTRKSALALSKSLDCKFTTHLSKIDVQVDIVLIAVSDDAIPEVAEQLAYLNDEERLFIHTSGSTPLKVLTKHFLKAGVFWPPQSIKKEDKLKIKKTPFVILAEDHSLAEVQKFAHHISNEVHHLTEEQKSHLHLAAVLANNFTTHLLSLAYDVCDKQGLDFELLKPIIMETTAKISDKDPSLQQTGPAIRGDQKTIDKHLQLLKKHNELKKIYKLISHSINPSIK